MRMKLLFGALIVGLAALAARRIQQAPALVVSPDPATLPGSYTVAASGLDIGVRYAVILDRLCDSDAVTYRYLIAAPYADSAGTFTFDRATEFCAGWYTVSVHPSTDGVADAVLVSATIRVDDAP